MIQSKRVGCCSDICRNKSGGESRKTGKTIECEQCKKTFYICNSRISKSKTKRFFCSQSCSAIYGNAHKKHGYRRSKLEIWIEGKIKQLYPNLPILPVDISAINAELDLYFPSLKLAFEFNGIFHYEPIYGSKKLQQIQSNDKRKFQACLEKGIELCIIDSSSLEYFKERNAQKFLDIVVSILQQKLSITLPAYAVTS